jgi:hypothetical protein
VDCPSVSAFTEGGPRGLLPCGDRNLGSEISKEGALTMKRATLAIAVLTVLFLAASQASAASITYTESAVVSGTVGSTPFTNALITIWLVGDTANVTGSDTHTVSLRNRCPQFVLALCLERRDPAEEAPAPFGLVCRPNAACRNRCNTQDPNRLILRRALDAVQPGRNHMVSTQRWSSLCSPN